MWLLRLIADKWFHRHRWDIIEQYTLTRSNAKVGTRYVLQCKNCGEIKHKDVE